MTCCDFYNDRIGLPRGSGVSKVYFSLDNHDLCALSQVREKLAHVLCKHYCDFRAVKYVEDDDKRYYRVHTDFNCKDDDFLIVAVYLADLGCGSCLTEVQVNFWSNNCFHRGVKLTLDDDC
jgi:hypothetical protein